MYKLINIFKSYNKSKDFILSDLNLNIEESDFIAIVGKSGSGKSTLLNILATIDVPTNGYYTFGEKNLSKLNYDELASFRNEKIGVVFQEYNLIESYSVKENILLPTVFAKKKQHPNLDSILKNLDIQALEDKQIKYLSGGERQRVAIGRAIVNNPKMVLADEPTGNLDEDSTLMIYTLLKSINSRGVAVIVVTHNLDLAKRFDKVYELKDGKLNLITLS